MIDCREKDVPEEERQLIFNPIIQETTLKTIKR